MPVWATWNATASSTQIWITWADNTTATTSQMLTTGPWQQWCDGTGAAGPVIYAEQVVRQPPEEEIAARARAEEQRQRERDAVKQRARRLLFENLTKTQRRELRQSGHFHVETADGRRRYRLRPGSPPMRVQSEDGRRYSYCIHEAGAYYGFPADDMALALKLLIEADEARFLEIANESVLA